MTGRPPNRLDDPELITSRVIEDENGCWIWQGAASWRGYGRIRIHYKSWAAHRASWTQANGPIPDGLTVDHICYVTMCVNPAHLRLLTLADNIRGRRVNSAPTCKHGHERTPENVVHRNGERRCRPCERARCRQWAAANRDYNRKRHAEYRAKARQKENT